jgi:hypothetical protein
MKLDSTSLLQNMIVTGTRFKNIPYSGEWAEIDTLTDISSQNI